MTLPFWKMHGAGNDFILLDARDGRVPQLSARMITAMCARRTGIGGDGLILLTDDDRATFRMRYYNADGCAAGMCANGARCIARLAHELGVAPRDMMFTSDAGALRAEVAEDGSGDVVLWMTPSSGACELRTLADGSAVAWIDTGVPHVVLETDDLDAMDVDARGRHIRWDAALAPAGANVNFVCRTAGNELRVRTFERGVEVETLACGTGVVAAALVMAQRGHVQAPVRVQCLHGDWLTVTFEGDPAAPVALRLRGPTTHVFRGSWDETTVA